MSFQVPPDLCFIKTMNLPVIEFMCAFVVIPQAFELATGDYLFEPHSGEDYSRDEGWYPKTFGFN